MAETYSLEEVNARLKEILAQVEDPDLPMEEILSLYEEAVKLGSKVGSMVEANISEADALAAFEAAQGAPAPEGEQAAASDAAPVSAEPAE